MILEIM